MAETPIAEPMTSAERMRLTRERRKNRLTIVKLDIKASEIDKLVERGLLAAADRNDPAAIAKAFYGLFEQTL